MIDAHASNNGKFVIVEAQNPSTVCDLLVLLVAALVSLGVRQHPSFPFEINEEEHGGEPLTRWRWVLAGTTADGRYSTADLVTWWSDPVWLAANPTHDLAIARTVLLNMATVAKGVRDSVPRIVVRRGSLAVHIPVTASDAYRAHMLAQLEGSVPMGTPFVEPEAAAA